MFFLTWPLQCILELYWFKCYRLWPCHHFEKKILELNEFKVKKLQEEREEKIKRKKETKKANQKEKKDTLNAAEDAKTHDSNEFVNTTVIEPKQILVQNPIL